MGSLETQARLEGRWCDIGWAESIALELAILWLIQVGHVNCNIIVHGDNAE